MMLIMSIVCLDKTLNKFIRLAEFLCSVNYVQPYMLQTFEENLYHMTHFREYRLFPDLFQIVPGWFQVVLDAFRLLQVTPRFSKYIEVLIKNCRLAKAYPENSVGGLEGG